MFLRPRDSLVFCFHNVSFQSSWFIKQHARHFKPVGVGLLISDGENRKTIKFTSVIYWSRSTKLNHKKFVCSQSANIIILSQIMFWREREQFAISDNNNKNNNNSYCHLVKRETASILRNVRLTLELRPGCHLYSPDVLHSYSMWSADVYDRTFPLFPRPAEKKQTIV